MDVWKRGSRLCSSIGNLNNRLKTTRLGSLGRVDLQMKSHVLMCQDQFAPKITAGTKLHTIRGKRKRVIRAGDKLSLRRWTGKAYRSKQEILKEVTCTRVRKIRIFKKKGSHHIAIEKQTLTWEQTMDLALFDGFGALDLFYEFFERTHGLPFRGILIEWAPVTAY